MKLTDRQYKEFKVSDIFTVKYGVNLELNACNECERDDEDAVNFVARTAENNGVSAYVTKIDGVVPQKSGLISVAGDGSVLSTFLQKEPFYSGRDLYTLDAKDDISDEAKMFIITVIEKNKYKYSYGRQANKTLPDLLLKLPVDDNGMPDYKFMGDFIKSLHHKPLTTKNKSGKAPELKTDNWKEFLLFDYFNIVPGKYHYPEEYEEGTTPYYSASNENNGIGSYIDLKPDFDGNCIVTGKVGCTAFYAPEPFCATSDVNIFRPKFDMSPAMGLFIANVINFNENYKWAYGRQCRVGNSKKIVIKLPVTEAGTPDWQFMEDFIKSLHHKPLTTKNKSGKAPELKVDEWKEFKVGDLFDVTGSTTTPLDELEEIGSGMAPYVTTSASENGVAGFYAKSTEAGNIICIESACAAYATYQAEDFSASDHVEKCIPKFDLNIYRAMFLVTILNLDQYKYSYGRKCNQIRIRDRMIKLPAKSDGTPDWQFMEDYIKSLPYGDRL